MYISIYIYTFFFSHTDRASQAQPCSTNSRARTTRLLPKELAEAAKPAMLARPCRREVPRDANPRTRPCGTAPASAAGPRRWRNPLPEDSSSRAPDGGTPLRNPLKIGASRGRYGGPAPPTAGKPWGNFISPSPVGLG